MEFQVARQGSGLLGLACPLIAHRGGLTVELVPRTTLLGVDALVLLT